MPLFSKCLNYIAIIMLISTPWPLLVLKKYILLLLFKKLWANGHNVVDNNGLFPPLLLKVLQFFSKLFITIVDNNGGFFFHSS